MIDWYLYSPIYDNEAYISHYSMGKKGLIYPEITAYSISLSCILYKRNKDTVFLERAKTCANFMMNINKNGGVPSFSDNLRYVFDTGIYISSMFDLYKITENNVYLDEAEKSLTWLYALWNGETFLAVDNIPHNRSWYHLPSVHLVKLVISLMKAFRYLGDQKYQKTALQLLNYYTEYQMKNGSFQVNKDFDYVMTHPHCYATEGFLYAYHVLKRKEFLKVIKKSSDWLSVMQNSDGSFYRSYNKSKTVNTSAREKNKTSDATAQATRIWKLLGENQEGIEKAYSYLNSELKNNGLRLLKSSNFGSMLFSWHRPVYSWPTFFYLHSLLLPFGELENCEDLF